MTRVLLLGGTAEARELAARLVDTGVPVTSSMAGRVSNPRIPLGDVRIGGFGGVDGLVEHLRDGEYTHLVDATHPFAATMTAHAVEAARAVGLPMVRLVRASWAERPDAEGWHWVDDNVGACRVASELGSRAFLTTGRQTLEHYLPLADRETLVRVVEPPADPLPAAWTVVRDRGPYSVEGETALMREHAVEVLVTKDSGGDYTAAKLDAAAAQGIPVVVVRRPATPTGVTCCSSVAATLASLS